jgi:hypothetical protein
MATGKPARGLKKAVTEAHQQLGASSDDVSSTDDDNNDNREATPEVSVQRAQPAKDDSDESHSEISDTERNRSGEINRKQSKTKKRKQSRHTRSQHSTPPPKRAKKTGGHFIAEALVGHTQEQEAQRQQDKEDPDRKHRQEEELRAEKRLEIAAERAKKSVQEPSIRLLDSEFDETFSAHDYVILVDWLSGNDKNCTAFLSMSRHRKLDFLKYHLAKLQAE